MKNALLVICLSLAVFGQTVGKNPPAAISVTEQLNLRNKQMAVYSLLDQKKQADAKFDADIAAAQNDLSNSLKEVFTSRKITVEDFSICDGPGQGVCSGVDKGMIVLRPNVKK